MSILSLADQITIDKKLDMIKAETGKRYPENTLLEIMKAYAPKLEVKEFDFGEYSKYIKGAIKYADGSNPAILINAERVSETGKNFTLAHEFGHFVLHENQEKFRLDLVDYNGEDTKQETEANYFAASLLMPRNEFEDISELTDDDYKIAAYFGVSVPAVKVRRQWIQKNKVK